MTFFYICTIPIPGVILIPIPISNPKATLIPMEFPFNSEGSEDSSG